ncbi:unnamed protein product [Choristocarpus tenellus]
MSALRFGADLSYVFTAEEAAPAIKAYSPELMVMPVYNVEKISDDNSQVVQKITDHFHRLHSLVIGPGLGRDVCVLSAASSVVKAAKKESLPLVLDADALEIIVRHDGDIGAMPFYGYGRVVLTPNAPEFVRLMNACGFENDFFVNEVANMDNPVELREGKGRAVERLAAALGNVVVILKGEVDVISDGRRTIACAVPGGMKRCGGLGDVLAGSLGTMLAWNRLHGVEGDEAQQVMMLSAAWWACAVTRQATFEACSAKGRSMSALHVMEHLGPIMEELVPSGKL